MIFGIGGACRKSELCNLQFLHVKINGDVVNVYIEDSKTHKERCFNILNEGFGINPIQIIRKYISLRPANSPFRFFLKYSKNKCYRQPVGINTFRAIPKKIASFLKLDDPRSYTGHAFRRSSATLVANSGNWNKCKVEKLYLLNLSRRSRHYYFKAARWVGIHESRGIIH